MNLVDFIEEFDGAPLTLEDVASFAQTVQDDKELSAAADKLLLSICEFEEQLERVGVVIG